MTVSTSLRRREERWGYALVPSGLKTEDSSETITAEEVQVHLKALIRQVAAGQDILIEDFTTRTRRNIEDSDGTLILNLGNPVGHAEALSSWHPSVLGCAQRSTR